MRIRNETELRQIVEPPHPAMRDKAIPVIDDQSRRFLAASTFFLLATASADGTMDVSPRGEPAGGVVVLDERRLAFPDRPGNRRLDSLRNILQRPQVGMLFVIPGKTETLRVNGRASVFGDPPFVSAPLGVVVEVEELFLHCGQSLKRASLWEPENWPAAEIVPTTGELIKSQGRHRSAPRPETADAT
ncbi:MSMEG_1061 family FMN-dependent PPOX-type flavoprotein [Actinoallomurus acaciae]|uniref:MSMEG_1061 family FMN-dependent PPOX-type flavoprotein n=1 Tax=Actinoallomurus acaciae TaxID=502577 RepID=A0ABV5YKL8_9ACTN